MNEGKKVKKYKMYYYSRGKKSFYKQPFTSKKRSTIL